MMIAIPLVATLTALAALHAYWGFGGRWPGHDDASMVERVVGRTHGTKAPAPAACFAVALALLACAVLAAHRAHLLTVPFVPEQLMMLGFWGAALVFAARGVATYVPGVFAYAQGTPFHRLNRILYGPLCLLIGAGFGMVGVAAI